MLLTDAAGYAGDYDDLAVPFGYTEREEHRHKPVTMCMKCRKNPARFEIVRIIEAFDFYEGRYKTSHTAFVCGDHKDDYQGVPLGSDLISRTVYEMER